MSVLEPFTTVPRMLNWILLVTGLETTFVLSKIVDGEFQSIIIRHQPGSIQYINILTIKMTGHASSSHRPNQGHWASQLRNWTCIRQIRVWSYGSERSVLDLANRTSCPIRFVQEHWQSRIWTADKSYSGALSRPNAFVELTLKCFLILYPRSSDCSGRCL